ncbi:hypothetical protein L1987_03269 [Smallanthus sonchifolius]|uniref:Uncharacterized protein n=1 Tax=Smallanthus sonchifolius TaxID=185202 RepID=A0ACB9KA93_9ASTR|nr:hypothetical protein L1987_03269 [Smallanthus sonchifolius]
MVLWFHYDGRRAQGAVLHMVLWLRTAEKATEFKGSAKFSKLASNYPPYSLVNQAFAIVVNDVLKGYIAALDTLYSSVGLRLLSKNDNMSCDCLPTV